MSESQTVEKHPITGAPGERRYFYPISLRRRLTYLFFCIAALLVVLWISLDAPIVRTAAGVHIIDIKQPGNYVAFFKGNIRDPFGWDTIRGRFRDALVVELEPYDSTAYVWKVVPFRDLSAVNSFSVAEFDVYHPGRYLLFSSWKTDVLKCDGTITLERNVVEKFFYRWGAGIVAGVSFLGFLGFPVSRRPG
ncbi:MAG: hypothetical protein AB7V06_28890 [Candidatus Obscuribacterales bacterium]